MAISTFPERLRAVLVGVQLPGVSDEEHAADFAELRRLVHTLGYDTVATVSQKRTRLATGTVLGTGKLKELAALTGGSGVIASGASDRTSKAREKWEAAANTEPDPEGEAVEEEADDVEPEDALLPPSSEEDDKAEPRPTVVVVDHELSPGQLRNLEKATGAMVLDRAGVIVDIFHRHAKSHEARMQVEIARLNYLAPGCANPPEAVSGSRDVARVTRRWSWTAARFATGWRSCARDWRPSRRTRTTAATREGTCCGWRWWATRTRASPR